MKRRRAPVVEPANPITCKALARACSLSVWTTSLALNHHPRVKTATQKRVTEMAARLGYAPNGAARRLAKARFEKHSARFDHAGFLLLAPPHVAMIGPYVAFLRGAGLGFAELDVSMAFLNASDEKQWGQAERMVNGKMLDGWLLAGDVTEDAVRRVRRWNQPFVVLGDHCVSRPVHHVNADNVAMGELAVRHLANLGHRHIALMGTTLNFQSSRDIREGFLSAVRELGLDCNEQLIQYLKGTESVHYYVAELLTRILAVEPRPTAIVIAESGHLQIAMNLIRQLKIRMPEKISFVSCEWEANAAVFPGVTQIQFPYESVGCAGAHLLKKLASHPRAPTQGLKIRPVCLDGSTCDCPTPSRLI